MGYPKIIYDAGGGNVTLAFTYPPTKKPDGDVLVATRTDSISLSGRKQSIYRRTDIFKDLQMDFVPSEDMIEWQAFIEYALTGGPFSYYPDADVPLVHNDWTLEDTNWNPAFLFLGMDDFKLRIRKVVPDSLGS